MSLCKCLRGILNKGFRSKSTLNAKGQGVNTCSNYTTVIQFILSGDLWTLYSALSFIFKNDKYIKILSTKKITYKHLHKKITLTPS